MKNIITLTLLAVFLIGILGVSYAAVGQFSVESQTVQDVSQLKARTESDSAQYVKIRQRLEDRLASYSGNLDSSDVTALNAMINKLQDIIDALNVLNTGLDTNFPAVE